MDIADFADYAGRILMVLSMVVLAAMLAWARAVRRDTWAAIEQMAPLADEVAGAGDMEEDYV